MQHHSVIMLMLDHATYDIIYSDTDSHVTPSTRALIYANSEQ